MDKDSISKKAKNLVRIAHDLAETPIGNEEIPDEEAVDDLSQTIETRPMSAAIRTKIDQLAFERVVQGKSLLHRRLGIEGFIKIILAELMLSLEALSKKLAVEFVLFQNFASDGQKALDEKYDLISLAIIRNFGLKMSEFVDLVTVSLRAKDPAIMTPPTLEGFATRDTTSRGLLSEGAHRQLAEMRLRLENKFSPDQDTHNFPPGS